MKFIIYYLKILITCIQKWLASKQEDLAKEGLKITRGRHKKSLSDNFNVNFDQMEEQQLKFYNMFMNNKPPDDFLKLLQKGRKETEDNLGLHAEMKVVDEPWYETPNNDLAIKNYPVSNSNLSSRVSSIHDLQQYEKLSEPKQNGNSKIFFNDDFDSTENLKDRKNNSNPAMSPIHYALSPPPGLTPTRYPQKTYSTDVIILLIYRFSII